MDNSNQNNNNQNNGNGSQQLFITQDMVLAGAIKQRHLAPSPVQVGDLYYGNGGNFLDLPIGTSGQVLTVASGKPVWATPTTQPQGLQLIDTTHPYKVQFGQGTWVVTGATGSATATTITYPTPFTTIIGAWIGGGGFGAMANGVVGNTVYLTIDSITNTSARALMGYANGSTALASGTYYFCWQAIGY